MGDVRGQLADKLAECAAEGMGAREIAEAVLDRYLVVDREDVEGTEYGWRFAPGWTVVSLTPKTHPNSRAEVQGEVVERPMLPWTPVQDGTQ